jgi:hypothetical protein
MCERETAHIRGLWTACLSDIVVNIGLVWRAAVIP